MRSSDGQDADQDWDVTLRAKGGGLIEAEMPTYVAPKDGYMPEWHLSENKDDPRWRSGLQKSFYLQSRPGQVYARCKIDMDTFEATTRDTDNARIILTYWLNKDSSRNLFSTTEYVRRDE